MATIYIPCRKDLDTSSSRSTIAYLEVRYRTVHHILQRIPVGYTFSSWIQRHGTQDIVAFQATEPFTNLSNPVIQNATLYEFVDWIKANEHLKLQIPVLTGAAPVNAVASASKPSVERLEVHDVNAIGLTRDRSDRPGIRGKPNYNDRKSGRWCSNCRMNNHWTRDCWHSEENRNRRPNKFRRGNDNQRYRNERNDRDERKDRDRRDHYKHRDNRDRRNYDKSHKNPREHDTRERPRKITKKEAHSSDSSNNEVTRDKDKR